MITLIQLKENDTIVDTLIYQTDDANKLIDLYEEALMVERGSNPEYDNLSIHNRFYKLICKEGLTAQKLSFATKTVSF